jgi:Bacterial transcriptional activator domain/AAA ATPase domain
VVDVEQFERAVAQGRPAEAVGLYAGDLLEGRYDDWLAAERERLAGLHADALQRLARQHEQDHRWPEAIRCAERLVARDPLREEYHRLLIGLCQASGDRARAVRAYHVCATTLDDELGIEPAPETRAVYESLVVGVGQASASRAKVPGTPPLVGRDDERARLVAAWRTAASGHPQLVLVTGEAGVGKTRLLVAATARREELDEHHPLTALTTALAAQGHLTEIGLARLSREDTARLAGHITGAPLGEAGLGRLYADSEGNPLFVVEALRPDAPAAASKVQAVIAGRLARLSPEAAAVAGVAAAIGRAFTADVLATVAGLDEPAFVAALDELWRRGILRAHGPNAYDFSHGRIRDAAYAALGPPRRRHLHLEIARALEGGGNPAAPAIAAHYERAGATAQAIHWHERAAEAAQWLHAHADAVRALERALALSGQLPAGPDTAALQLRLLTALPAPLLACEGYDSERMEQAHAQALRLAAQLGREPEPPLVWSLAMAALTRGEWVEAGGFAGQLRARAERDDDQVLWVESSYLQGIAAYWPGRLTEARGHFEAAMDRFRPEHRRAHVLRYGQDPELLVRLRLAHTLWLLGHPAEADRQRDLALRATAESSHGYSRAVVWVWAAIVAADRGEVAEFRRHVRELTAAQADEGPAQVRLAAELFAGHLSVLDGRTEAGLERMRTVHAQLIGGQAPAPGLPGVATRMLLEAYALAERPETGLALANEALDMGLGAELWEAEIRRLRATFLAACGAPAEQVEAELECALTVARRQQARAFEERIRATLTERSPGQGGAR